MRLPLQSLWDEQTLDRISKILQDYRMHPANLESSCKSCLAGRSLITNGSKDCHNAGKRPTCFFRLVWPRLSVAPASLLRALLPHHPQDAMLSPFALLKGWNKAWKQTHARPHRQLRSTKTTGLVHT